jgi:hypothetical protein
MSLQLPAPVPMAAVAPVIDAVEVLRACASPARQVSAAARRRLAACHIYAATGFAVRAAVRAASWCARASSLPPPRKPVQVLRDALAALEALPVSDNVAEVAAGAHAAGSLLVPQTAPVVFGAMAARQASEVNGLVDAAVRVLRRRNWVPAPVADAAGAPVAADPEVSAPTFFAAPPNEVAHWHAGVFAWRVLRWFGGAAVAAGTGLVAEWADGDEAARVGAATVMAAGFAVKADGGGEEDDDDDGEGDAALLAPLEALYGDWSLPVRRAAVRAHVVALQGDVSDAMEMTLPLFAAVAAEVAAGDSTGVTLSLTAVHKLYSADASMVVHHFADLCDVVVTVARGDFTARTKHAALDLVADVFASTPRLQKHGPALSAVIDAAMGLLAAHQGSDESWRGNLTSSTLESLGLTDSTVGSAAVEVVGILARCLGPKASGDDGNGGGVGDKGRCVGYPWGWAARRSVLRPCASLA